MFKTSSALTNKIHKKKKKKRNMDNSYACNPHITLFFNVYTTNMILFPAASFLLAPSLIHHAHALTH